RVGGSRVEVRQDPACARGKISLIGGNGIADLSLATERGHPILLSGQVCSLAIHRPHCLCCARLNGKAADSLAPNAEPFDGHLAQMQLEQVGTTTLPLARAAPGSERLQPSFPRMTLPRPIDGERDTHCRRPEAEQGCESRPAR